MKLFDHTWWKENLPPEDHPIHTHFCLLEYRYRKQLNDLSSSDLRWREVRDATDDLAGPLDILRETYEEALWIVQAVEKDAPDV